MSRIAWPAALAALLIACSGGGGPGDTGSQDADTADVMVTDTVTDDTTTDATRDDGATDVVADGAADSAESDLPDETQVFTDTEEDALADTIVDSYACFDAGADAVDGQDFPVPAITLDWFDCPLYDEPDKTPNPTAQCARAYMPLWWDRACGRTTPVYFKRLLSSAEEPRAQLWLIDGGPGASGVSDFPAMMEDMQLRDPELDLYTIDHRGVGKSGRLGCPVQEDPDSEYGAGITTTEFGPCIDYLEERRGDDLAAFRTTFAAVDMAAGIQAAREPGKSIFIWGGSYGSYLTQRFLQIFPDKVDGVLLEGISSPEISFALSREYYESAGRGVLAACMADEFCASKFPDGAEKTLADLLVKLDNGHCDILNMTSEVLSYILTYLNFYHPVHAMIPAVIYRLDHCTIADATVFYHMYKVLFGDDGSLLTTTGPWSMVLNHNVLFSEMWDTDRFADEAEMLQYWADLDETALFGMSDPLAAWEMKKQWPTYTDAGYDNGWAHTSVPMLMLQGELDPATPVEGARDVGNNFNGPHQTYVEFAGVPHNVVSGTPVSTNPAIMHCGQKLFVDFLKNPTAELDLTCRENVAPPDFQGYPAMSRFVFGAEDYWDAPPDGPAAPPPARSARAGSAAQGGVPYATPTFDLPAIRASIRAAMERDGVAELMDRFELELSTRENAPWN